MFKVGDRVKSKRSGATGTVVEVTGMRVGVKTDDARKGTELNTDIGHKRYIGLYLPESEWEKINDAKKILITHDGHTTLARLYEGNAVVKSAEAKCHPNDTFDFLKEGAPRAFERLVGDETAKTEPAKEDKPETIKLYCVKDSGFEICTKGKIYTLENGSIQWDGFKEDGNYADFNDYKRGGPSTAACLFPLVSRKAKIGETVYMLRDDCFGINKKGTITKCVGDDYVYDKTGKYTNPGISVQPQSEHYLVIDGYQPEPERCKCCGQVIKDGTC